MEEFKKKLEARERCVGANIGSNSGIHPTAPTKGNQPSTSALLSDSKVTCMYCKLPHPSAKCNAVAYVKERKNGFVENVWTVLFVFKAGQSGQIM